jgi:glycosyltransferase involved in cell wall biosynthesis
MKKIAIISTKNPTDTILLTIENLKKFYSDFEIVVIDSDSDNLQTLSKIPKDVTVHFIKNKNYELGAWYYAYETYPNYNFYLCIQDTLIPTKRIPSFDEKNLGVCYCIAWTKKIKLDSVNHGWFKRLHEIYENTNLYKYLNKSVEDITYGALHSSFLTDNNIMKNILQLEEVYKQNLIVKTKYDSCMSERSIAWIANEYADKLCDVTNYFRKVHGRRA